MRPLRRDSGQVTRENLARILRNWQDELDSAALYETLARKERDPRVKHILDKLAESERAHSAYWAQRLRACGHALPPFRPSLRARLHVQLARWFGLAFVGPHITTRELSDRDRYSREPDAVAAGLAAEEKGHAAVMRRVLSHGREAGHALGASAGNNLRAAVLGVNDGLVSNLCLIMGVAGGGVQGSTLVLSGVAGLVAGACSMALGEWLSVTNTREMAESQLDRTGDAALERTSMTRNQLSLLHEAEGMSEDAWRAAEELSVQDPHALKRLLHGEELLASAGTANGPMSAAAYSFALFAAGACVPLLPFLIASSLRAIIGSIVLSSLMLCAVGLLTSFFNGRSPLFSATRQVCIGAAAAVLTYGAGRLVGAALG